MFSISEMCEHRIYQLLVLIYFVLATRAQNDCVTDSTLGNNRAAGNKGEDITPNGNTDSTVIILDTGAGRTANPPEGEVSYTATCCGKITAWDVDPQKVFGPVESMKLQIWRHESGDSYYLVGEQPYTNANGFPAKVTATVDILVQVGDKLGFTGHELEYKISVGYNKDLAGRVLREDALNPTIGGSYTLVNEHPEADDHITPKMIGFAFNAILTERGNPECSLDIVAASFAEDSPVGTLVATITTSTFGDVTIPSYTFSLSDAGGLNIAVDAISGQVRTTGNLTAVPISSTFTITGRTTEDICFKYGECQGNVTVDWINQPIELVDMPATVNLIESTGTVTPIYTITTQDANRNNNLDMNPSCSIMAILPLGGPFVITSNVVTTKFDLKYDNSSVLSAISLPTYSVIVKCNDGYGSSATGTLTVSILKNSAPSVTNIPDSSGKICQEVNAKKTHQFDTMITLGITDTEADNIYSSFTKSDPSSPFDWRSASFEVFATEDLLAQQTRYHEFTVQIWDKWNSPVTYNLCVTIVGINSVPYFSICPAKIVVPETKDVGDVICTTAVTDANTVKDNQTHIFTLVNVHPTSFSARFTVDESTGDVKLVGNRIDYESSQSLLDGPCIVLEVSVTDGIHLSVNNCKICVSIQDINEAPVFHKKQYSYTMKEEVPVPATITSLSFPFTDPDTYDTHTYSILGTSGYFSIDTQTGVLTLEKLCDLEAGCPTSFTLVVEIDDGILQDQSVVSVTVEDVNDNAPIFTVPSYSITVSDETLLSKTLLTVTATDRDLGVNKDLTYWVIGVGLGSQYYSVDARGRLRLKKTLDHRNGTQYTISVCAADHGTPSQFGCTNIGVTYSKNTTRMQTDEVQPCFLCTSAGVCIFTALITEGMVLIGVCVYLACRNCVMPCEIKFRWPLLRTLNPTRRPMIFNLQSRRPIVTHLGTARTYPMPPVYRS